MIAVLGIGSGAYAKPCTMKPETAPTLFGFKLGMTQYAAEKMSGQTAEANGMLFGKPGGGLMSVKPGDMLILINNETLDSKIVDKTVKALSLDFMDGKLFQIWLELNHNSPWVKAPNTAALFQKLFRIPVGAWVDDPVDFGDYSKKAVCDGVSIRVFIYTRKSDMQFTMSETATRSRVDALGEAAAGETRKNLPPGDEVKKPRRVRRSEQKNK